ncbi:MAG: hypothetical protein Ct9H300mP11_04990 [Chloroflexota bacterium]|nr:MAG: hypothetical protein Ct9H300mP11_04990 [Chloroflexota bacterium]
MRQFRVFAKEVMPEFKQREEQRSVQESEDQLISEEV